MTWKLNPNAKESSHNHCWHIYRGPIWMVIPDGHVLQKCCKCDATQMAHVDHLHNKPRQWKREGGNLKCSVAA